MRMPLMIFVEKKKIKEIKIHYFKSHIETLDDNCGI